MTFDEWWASYESDYDPRISPDNYFGEDKHVYEQARKAWNAARENLDFDQLRDKIALEIHSNGPREEGEDGQGNYGFNSPGDMNTGACYEAADAVIELLDAAFDPGCDHVAINGTSLGGKPHLWWSDETLQRPDASCDGFGNITHSTRI